MDYDSAERFIDQVKATAHKFNITTRTDDNDGIALPNSDVMVNGYFCNVTMEIAVATGKPFDKWFPILVHESCHMDQYLEQIPEWCANIGGSDSMDIIDLWLENHVEMNKEQLHRCIDMSRAVELDCEKRSVEKINEYNLPIDVTDYIKRANAYLFFYHIIGETRKWYTVGKEPYNDKAIVEAMPDHFVDDYDNVVAKDEFLRLLND